MRSVFLLAALGVANLSYAASFDCTLQSLTDVENAICEDDDLSSLDDALAIWVDQKIDYLSTENEFGPNYPQRMEAFKTENREWLEERNQCGANVECLKSAYLERLEQPNIAAAMAQKYEMENLPEGEFVRQYFQLGNMELTWYARQLPTDDASDQAPNKIVRERVVVRKDGEILQSFKSSNEKYPFDKLFVEPEWTGDYRIIGLRETMRGGNKYVFRLSQSGIKILSKNLRGANARINIDSHVDYERLVISQRYSFLATDCWIHKLPVPISDPDYSDLIADYRYNDIFQIVGAEFEDKSHFIPVQIYHFYLSGFLDFNEDAISKIDALAKDNFQPAIQAMQCYAEVESVGKVKGATSSYDSAD